MNGDISRTVGAINLKLSVMMDTDVPYIGLVDSGRGDQLPVLGGKTIDSIRAFISQTKTFSLGFCLATRFHDTADVVTELGADRIAGI